MLKSSEINLQNEPEINQITKVIHDPNTKVANLFRLPNKK